MELPMLILLCISYLDQVVLAAVIEYAVETASIQQISINSGALTIAYIFITVLVAIECLSYFSSNVLIASGDVAGHPHRRWDNQKADAYSAKKTKIALNEFN